MVSQQGKAAVIHTLMGNKDAELSVTPGAGTMQISSKASKQHSTTPIAALIEPLSAEEMTRFTCILQEHKIDLSVEQALTPKGFRKVALALHPDKEGGNKENFIFVKELKSKFEQNRDGEFVENTQTWQSVIYEVSLGGKIIGTTLDAMRLYNEPTKAHFKQMFVGSVYTVNMLVGGSKLSVCASMFCVGCVYYENGGIEAAKHGAITLAFMTVPYALTYVGIPYVGFAYGVGMLGYIAYKQPLMHIRYIKNYPRRIKG